MKKIDIKALKESAVSLFDDKWCLITAGNKDSYNTMTASWGAMGELWNKDACFIFIRPQRYTLEFTEREELFTLSFFSEEYKNALMFCGRNSGRDCDKAKETGLDKVLIPRMNERTNKCEWVVDKAILEFIFLAGNNNF